MYAITFYNKNNEVVTEEFETYFHLIKFIAENGIEDKDFISMNMGDKEIIGMAGLVNEAIEVANYGIAAHEAMMAEEDIETEAENSEAAPDVWQVVEA